MYVCIYGGTTFDTNTHFLPNFRVSLQLNRSTKVNEILVDVSSMIYDCLYKFWAFQFIRNIPFLQFENRDFGKFYKFYIIYAGKLHCRNFVSEDLGLPAALRAAPLRWFCSLRSQNHRERLPAFWYRSLGVTKFCVYTNWYTVQIHLLEHSRVKICHRGATGHQRGWALARARISHKTARVVRQPLF